MSGRRCGLFIVAAVAWVALAAPARAQTVGDTISLTIGRTAITGWIEGIQGDTIALSGRVQNEEWGDLEVHNLRISLAAYVNHGQALVLGAGQVDFTGGPYRLGQVTVNGLTGLVDSTGFWATGDIAVAGVASGVVITVGDDGRLWGRLLSNQITIDGLVITGLDCKLNAKGFSGTGQFELEGNSLTATVQTQSDGSVTVAVGQCNLTIGGLQIKDFQGTFSSLSGLSGSGTVLFEGQYLQFSYLKNSAVAEIQVTDGSVVVHGLRVRNIHGLLSTANGFAAGGTIDLMTTSLSVDFTTSGDHQIHASVTDSTIAIGAVTISNLNLTYDSLKGLSGSGTVQVVRTTGSGQVTAYFETDLSGSVRVGISGGTVTLSNGHTITNLCGYFTNTEFYGTGTYLDGGSDVTVSFFKDGSGHIDWSIQGQCLTIGTVVLHHYYVDGGGGHGWWIVNTTDSLFIDVNLADSTGTIAIPDTIHLGQALVYDFTGTIHKPDSVGSCLSATGWIKVDGVAVHFSFGTDAGGRLIGRPADAGYLVDGISITLYGVELTFDENGLHGKGHLLVDSVEADIEFVVNTDGSVSGRVANGKWRIGNVQLQNVNLSFDPFSASADAVLPDIAGGTLAAGFDITADHQLGLRFSATSIDINGFTLTGSVAYAAGNVVAAGNLQLPPPGGIVWIDSLTFNSTGFVQGNFGVNNIPAAGFTVVSATAHLYNHPFRMVLSGVVDVSATGVLGQVSVLDLAIDQAGNVISCGGAGVTGLNLKGFAVISAGLEITKDAVILDTLGVSLASLGGGTAFVQRLVIDKTGHYRSVSAFGVQDIAVGAFSGSGWAQLPGDSTIVVYGNVALRNIGHFSVKALTLKYDGTVVAIAGADAAITIGGYGFSGGVQMPQRDELIVNGGLQLPQFIEGTGFTAMVHLKYVGSGGVLNTGYRVVAGSGTLPGFLFQGYQFGSGAFIFDSAAVAGNFDVRFPGNDIAFNVMFGLHWDGSFDSCYVAAAGTNIPLGTTGLVLNGIGGGLYRYTNPGEYWKVVVWGELTDVSHSLSADATLYFATNGSFGGVGHLSVSQYPVCSASLDVDVPATTITAVGWLGDDPGEGISTWGCYVKGVDTLRFDWSVPEAWSRANLEAGVWFVTFEADAGLAVNWVQHHGTYFSYGPYYGMKLYGDGVGAGAYLSLLDNVYGLTAQKLPDGWDFHTWSCPPVFIPGNAPYLKELLVCGPYPATTDAELGFQYLGDDTATRPFDSHPAVGGKTWLALQSDVNDYFDLQRQYAPAGYAVAYAHSYVYNGSNSSTAAKLFFGWAGAAQLFCNGQQVFDGGTHWTYASKDRDTVDVSLRPGWNYLLAKLHHRSNESAWGFYLKLADADGDTVSRVTTQPDNPRASVLYHERFDNFNSYRWRKQGDVAIRNLKLQLVGIGATANTYAYDSLHYSRRNSPVMKTEFLIKGDHDTTIIGAEGYTDLGGYRRFGVIYSPAGKGGCATCRAINDEGMSGERTTSGKGGSIYLNKWYTQELVFDPDAINLSIYPSGEAAPLQPWFVDSSADWDPRFFARCGGMTAGADSALTLIDDVVMKEVYKTTSQSVGRSPLPDWWDTTYVIAVPGASAVRAHFTSLRLEQGCDSLFVYGPCGKLYAAYTGDYGAGLTTPPVTGDTLKLRFKTDGSTPSWGFALDRYQYATDRPAWRVDAAQHLTLNAIGDNYSNDWSAAIPGAVAVRAYFTACDLDSLLDRVEVGDASAYQHHFATYTGRLAPFATVAVPGNAIMVKIRTGNSGNSIVRALKIDHLEYFTGSDWVPYAADLQPAAAPRYPLALNSWPNPFGVQATVSYQLAQAGPATLQVYNMLGQQVRTLASGPLQAGPHQVRWNGTNGQGRRLAAGTYFLRLRCGGGEIIKRISLIR